MGAFRSCPLRRSSHLSQEGLKMVLGEHSCATPNYLCTQILLMSETHPQSGNYLIERHPRDGEFETIAPD